MKQMLKRKDGSVSQRGLWDNIRANRGSGKKPTAQMLKQEKKIKMAKVKKAQKGVTATADSSAYFRKQGNMAAREMGNARTSKGMSIASNKIAKATKNEARQKLKGKPGYDANGFPLKKSRMGSSVKKAQDGVTQEWYNPRDKSKSTRKTITADSSGYAAGAKKFPTTSIDYKGVTRKGSTNRRGIKNIIKNPRMGVYYKKGGKMSKNK